MREDLCVQHVWRVRGGWSVVRCQPPGWQDWWRRFFTTTKQISRRGVMTMATATSERSTAKVVPQAEWVAARKELLTKEKEFTRLRDELSRQRRELPWEQVKKKYVFTGPKGKETLADLFDGRSQLIVYHFMFGPGWKEGCPSCSFVADSFDGIVVHLAQRDVTLTAVSRATLPEIDAFKKRMGWRFKWVSSFENEFNF